MGRNRTVVNAVIPFHQSIEIRRRLVVATAESKPGKSKLDSVHAVQVPELMSDVVVLASVTHKTIRCIEHGLEAIQ